MVSTLRTIPRRRCTNSLGQRPALADGDLVAVLDTEGGGDMGREVLVALLVTVVFGDVMEVFAADDERAVHLGRDDSTGQDTATDRDEAGEGAFFVYRTGCVLVYPLKQSRWFESRIFSFFLGYRNSIQKQNSLPPPPPPPPPSPSSPIPQPPPPASTKTQSSRLTDISPLNGVLGGLETQADILVPSPASFADPTVRRTSLIGEKDVGLLLESPLGLDCQFGGHSCCCGW